MPIKTQDPNDILASALAHFRDGFDPALIELPEAAIFPGLIPAQPATARKARTTGSLLGRPAPRFVKRGRTVRYRLKDVLDWLADGDTFGSTAEVGRLALSKACRLETRETRQEVANAE